MKPGELNIRKPTGFCIVWNCGKPLKDKNGKPLGRRGMCWRHLKQAQRAGDLVAMQVHNEGECSRKHCHEPAKKRGLCIHHYDHWFRNEAPSKDKTRERKAQWRRDKYARSAEQRAQEVSRQQDYRRRKRNESQLGTVA